MHSINVLSFLCFSQYRLYMYRNISIYRCLITSLCATESSRVRYRICNMRHFCTSINIGGNEFNCHVNLEEC